MCAIKKVHWLLMYLVLIIRVEFLCDMCRVTYMHQPPTITTNNSEKSISDNIFFG